jgi:hypothetical protein
MTLQAFFDLNDDLNNEIETLHNYFYWLTRDKSDTIDKEYVKKHLDKITPMITSLAEQLKQLNLEYQLPCANAKLNNEKEQIPKQEHQVEHKEEHKHDHEEEQHEEDH